MLGKDKQTRRITTELTNIVDITIEGIWDYQLNMRQISSFLTDRQQQILEIAVERGYYEIPRQTSLDDIGEEPNITAGTVGEYLQKIGTKSVLNEI